MSDEQQAPKSRTQISADGRRALSLAMKKRWAEAKKAGRTLNGPKKLKKRSRHATKKKQMMQPRNLQDVITMTQAALNGNGHPPPMLTTYPNSRKLARQGIQALAVEGARLRLGQLQREIEVLQIFIQGAK